MGFITRIAHSLTYRTAQSLAGRNVTDHAAVFQRALSRRDELPLAGTIAGLSLAYRNEHAGQCSGCVLPNSPPTIDQQIPT